MPDVGAEKNDSGYYYPHDRATLVYNENYGTSEPSTINASDLNPSLGDANEEFMRQEELRKNEEVSRQKALQKDQDAQIQAARENIELQMLSAALTAKPTATPDVADRKPQISQQMVRLFIGGQDKGDVPAQISYIPQYTFNFDMYTPEKSQLDLALEQIRSGAATVSDLLDVRKYMLPLAALTVMNSDVLTAGLLDKFKSTKTANKELSNPTTVLADEVKVLAESPWTKGPLTRGNIIDRELGNNLGRTFPTVDKLESGVLTSTKSMDVLAPTYQNEVAMFGRMKADIDALKGFQSGMKNGVFVSEADFTRKVFELALPEAQLTAQQLYAINRAKQYAVDVGIEFRIVVVK